MYSEARLKEKPMAAGDTSISSFQHVWILDTRLAFDRTCQHQSTVLWCYGVLDGTARRASLENMFNRKRPRAGRYTSSYGLVLFICFLTRFRLCCPFAPSCLHLRFPYRVVLCWLADRSSNFLHFMPIAG